MRASLLSSTASSTSLHKRLSRDEVAQRVVRLSPRASFFPDPDQLFDIWHQGLPWAAKLRTESCTCSRPGGWHFHRYIECGELHAGLDWRVDAQLNFDVDAQRRIQVSGDLEP